jgi:hypothetical protein
MLADIFYRGSQLVLFLAIVSCAPLNGVVIWRRALRLLTRRRKPDVSFFDAPTEPIHLTSERAP